MAAVVATIGVVALPPAAAPSAAAGPQQYGAPTWLPLRGNWVVGCTWGNGCDGGYHGYAAIDLARDRVGSIAGDPVYAAGAGLATIVSTGSTCGGAGNVVQVDHGGNVKSYYHHLSGLAIGGATWVDENSVIGYVGHTGPVSPCSFNHLHFEVRHNGTRVSPGQLKACHGGQQVTYPAALRVADWNQVPRWSGVRNDGTGCRAFADGTFLRGVETGRVYRVVGGAPLWLSTCVDGCSGLVDVAQATIDAMPRVPADGSFVRAVETGRVYRVAGGAPLWLSTCVDGCAGLVNVNQWTVDNLRQRPADGTFLRTVETGRVYRVAGGAPLWLSTCVDGCAGLVNVNQWTIDNLDHLSAVPADGTLLLAHETGRVYEVTAGSPVWLSSCPPQGCVGYVRVNQWTIDTRDHLLP